MYSIKNKLPLLIQTDNVSQIASVVASNRLQQKHKCFHMSVVNVCTVLASSFLSLQPMRYYSLTSLCFLSHYPFVSNFRECLHILRQLVSHLPKWPLQLKATLIQWFNFLMSHSRPLFLYCYLFFTVDSNQMFYIKVRPADLWCQKRPLYQLSHNHYPNLVATHLS